MFHLCNSNLRGRADTTGTGFTGQICSPDSSEVYRCGALCPASSQTHLLPPSWEKMLLCGLSGLLLSRWPTFFPLGVGNF